MSINVWKSIKNTFNSEESLNESVKMFCDSVEKANQTNAGNWAIHLCSEANFNALRLHVGGFIIATIIDGTFWCSLKKDLITLELKKKLDDDPLWKWSDGKQKHDIVDYKKWNKFSKNGYYHHKENQNKIKDIISQLNLEYINFVGNTFIHESTKKNHNDQIKDIIYNEFDKRIPSPSYI